MRGQSWGYRIFMAAGAVAAALALAAWAARDLRAGWPLLLVAAFILIALALRHTVFRS